MKWGIFVENRVQGSLKLQILQNDTKIQDREKKMDMPYGRVIRYFLKQKLTQMQLKIPEQTNNNAGRHVGGGGSEDTTLKTKAKMYTYTLYRYTFAQVCIESCVNCDPVCKNG